MTDNYTYRDHKSCESDREFSRHRSKCQKNKETLLECGQSTGKRTFESSNDTPFQLAHVTLDTTCLNKAKVLIKFSSLVRVERTTDPGLGTVQLKYELLRTCEGEEPLSLGNWLFEQEGTSFSDFEDAAEESFNFIFCDCITCPACCDYFVKVTPIELTNATATVSNGRIAALAQSLRERSNDELKIYESKHECIKSKTEFSGSKETILACGNGNGSVIFKTENEPPVSIANVTTDTSGLFKPKVLVTFSTIISYIEGTSPSETISFQFELFRVCDNGEPISLGNWKYEVGVIGGGIESAQGFGFTFCECMNFSGCCEYFVVVTPNEVPTGFAENAIISNSRMTALAQSFKPCDRKYDIIDCEPKHIKAKEVLLECGQGNGIRTFNSSDEAAFQLANVSVDLTGLSKSIVNVEFSSIVNFIDAGLGELEAILRYELFRVCENGGAELRGIWVLERIDQDSDRIIQSFDFTFCESNVCKTGCCTYFVKVTPIKIVSGQVRVSDGRIAALVQEGK